jgi:hypothetical protein
MVSPGQMFCLCKINIIPTAIGSIKGILGIKYLSCRSANVMAEKTGKLLEVLVMYSFMKILFSQ